MRVRIVKGDSSETNDYPLADIQRIGGKPAPAPVAAVENADEPDEELLPTNETIIDAPELPLDEE